MRFDYILKTPIVVHSRPLQSFDLT